MRKALALILAIGSLLLVLAAPRSVGARRGDPTPTPTPTVTAPSTTPTPARTPTLAPTPSPTPTSTPGGPPAPTLLGPAGGAQLVEPLTFSWSPVSDPSGILGYNLEVSTSSTFQLVVLHDSTNAGTTQVTESGLPNGTYYWHVDVVNGAFVTSPWSAVRSFTITGQAAGTPGTPSFTGPANGAQFHPYESFNWTWTAVPNAVSYLLEQDVFDSTFNGSQVDRYPQSGTTYNQEWGNPLIVYARVRGVAADGTLGLPSATLMVNITYSAPLPPAPILIGPADGAHVTLPITFTWNVDPNPQIGEYTLEVADDSNFTGGCGAILFCNNQITGSQYTLTYMSTGTKYWRVQAMHGDASPTLPAVSPWSATRSFIPDVPPTGIGSVALSRSSVVVGDTGFLGGNVTLNAPAPPGGAVVSLSSSNPSALAVQSSVSIAQDTTGSPSFTLTLGHVSVQTVVTITATYNGSSGSATMTILLPALDQINFANGSNAVSVFGGNPASASILLNGPAPSGGAVVALSSSDAATAAVPSSVTVPAGATSASFTVTTSPVGAARNVTITASWQGVSRQATVNVVPNVAPNLLSPADGSSFTSGATINFDWSDVAGATLYQIQISTSSNFSSLLVNQVVFSSDYSTNSLPAQQLWWRALPIDGTGRTGAPSSARSITIR
jgi:hypothetical protein